MMTFRDFVKVANYTRNEYAHISVFDKTGMIDCGEFSSIYKVPENDPLLDYEVIDITGDFYLRLDIDKADAERIGKIHNKARNLIVYGKE